MKILCLPDPHLPYESPGLMSFLRDIKVKQGPFDHVVCLGDMYDMICFSKFPKDPDCDSLNQEIDSARIQTEALAKIFPKMTVLVGNHEARFIKRAAESNIPSKFLRKIEDIMEFPNGWKYVDRVEIDGVLFEHGESVSGRAALDSLIQLHRQNCVIGHLHSLAGIKYMNNGNKTVWAAAFGCLVDPDALVFKYGRHSKDKPVRGCGIIEDGVPRFIPFYVPKGGHK